MTQENSQQRSALKSAAVECVAVVRTQDGTVWPHDDMSQTRAVTDLSQDDEEYTSSLPADSDIYGQELMKTIEAMNRDMKWLRGSQLKKVLNWYKMILKKSPISEWSLILIVLMTSFIKTWAWCQLLHPAGDVSGSWVWGLLSPIDCGKDIKNSYIL